MSDTPDEQLENQLRELTTWPDPPPNLWRRALAAAGSQHKKGRSAVGRVLSYRPSFRLAVGVAAAAIFIAVGMRMDWGTLPGGRQQEAEFLGGVDARLEVSGGTDAIFEQDGDGAGRFEFLGQPVVYYGYQLPYARGGKARQEMGVRMPTDVSRGGPYLLSVAGQSTPGEFQTPAPEGFVGPEDQTQEPAGRYVIRKATVELVTEDVRAVFLKAALLVSEAKGEYVQDSGITGSGEKMQANLTLRVAAERLPEVLNELRQLGDVRSEKTTGEDVTTQVVDLEARLRNEQRVEAELLQLLEKREDSPLKEILEIRRTIADVRQAIEQLTAQRERLSRLVSLATVLVIIRPADAPPPPKPEEPGLGAYFIDALGGAWHKGTTFLVNTFAGFVSVIIGGLIWWILLIIVIVLVRNYLRRRTAATG